MKQHSATVLAIADYYAVRLTTVAVAFRPSVRPSVRLSFRLIS